MEKAIEIKRRAQRCVQNGDLDGALGEYEKLVAADDSDPYSFVLLADLLYKKGDHAGAARRYLSSTDAYQKNTLYKNAIAVCKKMVRLSLSPAVVLQRLAVLHALDGLTTEAALFHMQHADLMLREDKADEAAASLRSAFEISPDNVKTLERLADVNLVRGDKDAAVQALSDAIHRYEQSGQGAHAERCRNRLTQIRPGSVPRAEPDDRALEEPPDSRRAMRAPQAAREPEESLVLESGLETATYRLRSEAQAVPADAFAGDERAAGEGHGLRFRSPAEAPEDEVPADPPAGEPAMADRSFETAYEERDARAEVPPEDGGEASDGNAPHAQGMARIEELLTLAQEQFRSGRRDVATSALVEAAGVYEELGQFDNAATIYRSLSKSATAARDVMMLWMRNCEVRRDLVEAAQVACELGDLALNEGDHANALSWFKHARSMDATNALAFRRLERLRGGGAPEEETRVAAGVAAAPSPPAAAKAAPAGAGPQGFEPGRVEVEVGRGGAVTFDLGSLVSEFQRGIEAQIAGDAQGHYDLAMTYREMGLLEQAIEAFRSAAVDPAFAVRCSELIGRSLLDEGRFDEAGREFETGLNLPGLTPMARADLRYQLGLSHEAAGRVQEALADFERVYAMHASYPDVALKIRVLRKMLESL